jgi:low temperature requirement protein LtrA
MLGVIYWMYDGYAWLHQRRRARRRRAARHCCWPAWAGFLLIALAVPAAFTASGWAFGVGYFVRQRDPQWTVAARRPGSDAPARSAQPAQRRRWCWPAWLLHRRRCGPLLGGRAACHGGDRRTCTRSANGRSPPSHFVERHGLIVIIALGESVVAIGPAPRACH